MKTEIIPARNISATIIMILLSGTMLNGSYNTGQDLWISFILSFFLVLPLILIYCRIVKLYPQKDLFSIIDTVFGKIFGTIIMLFMLWYAFHLGALTISQFVEYTKVISLEDAPSIVLMIIILIVAYYLARSGLEILGRWSFVVCIIVLGSLVFILFIAYSSFDFSNLLPLLNHSPKQIMTDSIFSYTSIFGDTMLVLIMFSFLKKKESSYKAYFHGIYIGGIAVLLVFLRNILVIGPELMEVAIFPSYMVYRIMSVGNFFESFESIISIHLILIGITKVTVCLSAAHIGTTKILKVKEKDKQKILLPVALLMLAVCSLLFQNMADQLNFNKIYPYYALPFQIVIPILIWIFAEIKAKRNKPAKLTA